jgi:taurine dioxygenase
MKLIPSDNLFGAMVLEFNVDSVSDEDKTQLRAWIDKHKVLSFLDQEITLEQFEKFGSLFGSLSNIQSKYYDNVDGILPLSINKYVSSLTRKPTTDTLFGGTWHSDFAALENPPAYTILYADRVPSEGGDTLFIDQVSSFNDCDIELKEKLNNLNGIFGSGVTNEKNKHNETVHSLVKIHLNTKESYIFNSPAHLKKIDGLDHKSGYKLMRDLYNHVVQDKHIYTVKWLPKMITIWDNRFTLHKATKTMSPQERVMYRMQVDNI